VPKKKKEKKTAILSSYLRGSKDCRFLQVSISLKGLEVIISMKITPREGHWLELGKKDVSFLRFEADVTLQSKRGSIYPHCLVGHTAQIGTST
jgi:hypothetical protein